MSGPRITRVSAEPLDAPLREPFEIATGSQISAQNVLVTVTLRDGTRGYGECAPFPAFNGETQAKALAACAKAAEHLEGRKLAEAALRGLHELLPPCSARAGLEMALLDAWGRHHGIPLRLYFGGCSQRVSTDVTIPIVPPQAAARSAAAIAKLGIRALKIKVGKDPGQDEERVVAALSRLRARPLILDGNGGYETRAALDLLRRLKRRGIIPDLFEQPTPKQDLDGLRAVSRRARVAADESVATREDMLRLAKERYAQVVNIKLMKCGIQEAWDIARIARAAGIGLMIGGMVETRLAMACAAHLAAGFGGFRFIDLDTPLYFASDPMGAGTRIGRGGVYDLSRVRGGIGVFPKRGHPLKATKDRYAH